MEGRTGTASLLSPTHKGSTFYHVRLSIGRSGLLPLRPTATMRRTSCEVPSYQSDRGGRLEVRGRGASGTSAIGVIRAIGVIGFLITNLYFLTSNL